MVFDLNDANYVMTVESENRVIFIDFYSPMCGPCQEVLPKLDTIESYFKGDVLVAKVDVTQNPKLATKYEIQSVPFCVAISAKDKVVKDYELGGASVDRYIAMVKKAQGKGFFSRLFG